MKRKHILHALPLLTAMLGIAVLTPLMPSAEEPMPTEASLTEPTQRTCRARVSIQTEPDKLLYRVGETLDLTGLTVGTSICVDGTWMPEGGGQSITSSKEFSVDAPDMTHLGVKPVTIRYSPHYDEASVGHIIPGYAHFNIIVTDMGDMDVNGILDTADLQTMQRVLQGKETLSGEAAVNADMNADGEIDAFDLALMKRNLKQNVTEYMELTPTVRADDTNAVTTLCWDYACSQNNNTYLITDTSSMNRFCIYFQSAVQRSLLKTYNDDFFKDNILILHLDPLDYKWYEPVISDISYKNRRLTVTTEHQAVENGKKGIRIWQIALPRSQYNKNAVAWTEKDTEYYDGDLTSTLLKELPDTETLALLEKGVLVTNAEERAALFSQVSSLQEIPQVSPEILEAHYKNTAEYYLLVPDLYTKKSVWQLRKTGNRITADIRKKDSFGDIMEYYVVCLSIPAELAADDPEIVLNEVSCPIYTPLTGKVCYYGHIGTPALAVNQYSFGDEYETAFYWAYTVGLVQYAKCDLIESFAVSADASQFRKDARDIPVIEEESEGYRIEWGEDSVTVTFLKSKAAGEQETLTIPYPEY